jgi:hypothetical protein
MFDLCLVFHPSTFPQLHYTITTDYTDFMLRRHIDYFGLINIKFRSGLPSLFFLPDCNRADIPCDHMNTQTPCHCAVLHNESVKNRTQRDNLLKHLTVEPGIHRAGTRAPDTAWALVLPSAHFHPDSPVLFPFRSPLKHGHTNSCLINTPDNNTFPVSAITHSHRGGSGMRCVSLLFFPGPLCCRWRGSCDHPSLPHPSLPHPSPPSLSSG